MEIVKIIVFEYIFGYILQGFSFTLGISAFNRQKIDFKKYIFVSIVLSAFIFLVRLLPISFGVHTILNLLFLFAICVLFLKMPIYATIRSTLIVTVLLLLSESLNVAVMIGILGNDEFNRRMLIPLEKAIIGLPGALIFSLIIFVFYIVLTRSKKQSGG
ncbi:MAG: hypothetical protein PHZ09_11200 [Eubacteriales bacterium]|nr:hypothetical protein [Eubacteriales bacterium]